MLISVIHLNAVHTGGKLPLVSNTIGKYSIHISAS